MTNGALETIITILLGGGLLKGIESVYRAYVDGKEKQRLFNVVGTKTPVEIESVSIATMAAALTSAQERIKNLVIEREQDQTYYDEKFKMLNDHISTLEAKIEALRNQNLELLSIQIRKGGANE